MPSSSTVISNAPGHSVACTSIASACPCCTALPTASTTTELISLSADCGRLFGTCIVMATSGHSDDKAGASSNAISSSGRIVSSCVAIAGSALRTTSSSLPRAIARRSSGASEPMAPATPSSWLCTVACSASAAAVDDSRSRTRWRAAEAPTARSASTTSARRRRTADAQTRMPGRNSPMLSAQTSPNTVSDAVSPPIIVPHTAPAVAPMAATMTAISSHCRRAESR